MDLYLPAKQQKDKRNHIAGNIYTENVNNINIHKYGAHIFHTSNEEIWKYINQFATFNNYINSPVALYENELFNLPFNMNTFYQLWKTRTPDEAKKIIREQVAEYGTANPQNLEEQALSLVGKDIYVKLIKGYTEKQWGRSASELPAFIIRRLPLRYTFDNNYFNDIYQGIPIGGYTGIIQNMLTGIEVQLNTNYFDDRDYFDGLAHKTVFTGMIDQFFDYKFGTLEYRSLKFEHKELETDNYQGNAVVNYTEQHIPYTRIIEHKHFEFGTQANTIITYEYPDQWDKTKEPYYPINDDTNDAVYKKYSELKKGSSTMFGGRLADYKYYDMHHVLAHALKGVREEFKNAE